MSPDRPDDIRDTLPQVELASSDDSKGVSEPQDQAQETVHLVLDALRGLEDVPKKDLPTDTFIGGGAIGLIDQKQAEQLINLDEEAHALPLVPKRSGKTPGHDGSAEPPSKEVIAKAVEKRMTLEEAEHFREVRAVQLQFVLDLAANYRPVSDVDLAQLLANAKSHCPSFSQEELLAMLNQHDLVRNNLHLQGALITGGRKVLEGPDHKLVSIFSMSLLGQGGLGKVTDAYLLKDACFVPAVVKESHQWDIDPNDPQVAEKTRQNQVFQANFLVEMNNAIDCLTNNVPGMIKPLLVVPGNGAEESSLIAYEKIANKDGASLDFGYLATDPRFLISKKLATFAGAATILADLHASGRVHLDFKPENVMVNEKGDPVVIDIGSRIALNDEIHIDPDADPKPHGSITKRFDYGLQGLAFTPHMLPLAPVKRAVEQGKSLEVVDRLALGNSLVNILRDAGFLVNPNYPDVVTYQKYFNLPDDKYPPASLLDMLALATELRDIDSDTPLRPLTEIAAELRLIATRFQLELDPLQIAMCNQHNVVLKSDL